MFNHPRVGTLDTFSDAERTAAAVAAADPQSAQALAVRDFNVTETLAGAPELIRRYAQARGAAQTKLDAAVDIRRLGIQAALTPDLLCAGRPRLPHQGGSPASDKAVIHPVPIIA